MGKLSAAAVKALGSSGKPGRHGDGDGLYLSVAPAGTKAWVQRIVVHGRRRDIGLGPYPTVSLARARDAPSPTTTALPRGTPFHHLASRRPGPGAGREAGRPTSGPGPGAARKPA